MSERIYACLLRLYPRHFRDVYGADALQLFRDRCRTENGLLLKLRLWFDLIIDLIVSVPRQYRRTAACTPNVLINHPQRAVPSFHLLGYQPPRLPWLLLAAALSAVTFGSIPLSIGRGGRNRPAETSLVPLPDWQTTQQHGITAWSPAATANHQLDVAERRHVVEAVIRNLKRYYFDAHVAQQMADALAMRERNGDYGAVMDGGSLARTVTRQIREVSHDMHLEVVYSTSTLPNVPREPTPEFLAAYRKELEQNNCGFETVQVRPHNIGYLKLNSFPDVSICRPTAQAAMASLNQVNAIIFDLRENGGGSGGMVTLIAGYLFDHPEFLYDPRTNPTPRSWTQPVAGNKLANKPVYILTSSSTISAAEQFAYDLKMLKRATVVGETTRGSAHAGVFHRIDDHFGVGIPALSAMNPFSKADWEAVGVRPDVEARADEALETAVKLAEAKK